MEVQDSPLQLLPLFGLEDSGGHAAERGVGHVHGGAGASLDHLHPGHHLVQQVDSMADAQRVSRVALETQTHVCCFKLQLAAVSGSSAAPYWIGVLTLHIYTLLL